MNLQLILKVLDNVGVRTQCKPVKLFNPKPRTLLLYRAGLVLNHEKESCLLLQNRKKSQHLFQYRSLYWKIKHAFCINHITVQHFSITVQEVGKKHGWLTGEENQKRGSRGASPGGKRGTSPKWTCASGHLKQEAHSVEHYQPSQRGLGGRRTFAAKEVLQGGWGWQTLRYSASNKLMSGLPRLVSEPRPAPRRLGVWLMILSTASIAPLHHPLLPGWPCNVGTGSLSTCVYETGSLWSWLRKSLGDEKGWFEARATVYKIPGDGVNGEMAVPSPGQHFSSHLTGSEARSHFFTWAGYSQQRRGVQGLANENFGINGWD